MSPETIRTIEVALIVAVIIVISVFQVKMFLSTLKKLKAYKNIFPQSYASYGILTDEETGTVRGIRANHSNTTMSVIVSSINKYLDNNQNSVSDFHLIKDIIDRNCDADEEEIQTQVPMPMYFGLMGTMAGILVGVAMLVISGGVNTLISGTGGATAGVTGIDSLLGGVALAMVTSILGIILTTAGSTKTKNAKVKVESGKNVFLSWMQATLLPELSSDTASAMQKLTDNLNSFNRTFSTNNTELRSTLEVVGQASRNQAELIQKIDRLRINQIATANISVYEALADCTEEIGQFGQYVNNINNYIRTVNALAQKLDSADERVKMIEEMAAFFRDERANLESMRGLISHTIARTDEKLCDAANDLTNNTTEQFTTLKNHFVKQTEMLREIFDQEQRALTEYLLEQNKQVKAMLSEKSQELTQLMEEIKSFSLAKESLSRVEKLITEQNSRVSELVKAIMALANKKFEGGMGLPVEPLTSEEPKWKKYAYIIPCAFISLTCVVVIIKVLIG